MRSWGTIGSADQNIYVVTLQTMIALPPPFYHIHHEVPMEEIYPP